MASLQCSKRVHLEVHRPELAEYSAATESAFATGHEVGDIAIRLLGGDNGIYVEYHAGGSLGPALRRTAELMSSLLRQPIYEATLEHDGVLVREDILLPNGDGWRIIEVKASTSLKPEHLCDCAVQAWVHTCSGHSLQGISLAHVNNQFVYPGQDDYRGLLLEIDVTDQVMALLPEVPVWVAAARSAIVGPVPEVPVGQHCVSPYECPFMHHCWPQDSAYPVAGLGGSRKKLGEWVSAGYRDILDVPANEITAAGQLRIRRVTAAGTAELLPGARRFARDLAYPRYYLDFETIAPAVPRWAGTRPYEVLPFQWSCHVEGPAGELRHEAFLDLSGDAPMRPFAESLLAALGSDGPVLMYTDYERRVIQGLVDRFPDLAEPLQGILERLVDLYPVTRDNYYHPDMLGSWSIKAVLPTIAADMDYALLDGIREGTAASAAYFEAIDAQTSQERKEQIRQQLLSYCRHDTEAMRRLLGFFQRS
jgi:hypothetical protein